ncbi:uncharacterized protein BJ212DRAFT_1388735 [Suillus subaureus]|uniref:Uncharacterized protein n=1 Tax=Suillus subaureus TaxID=48587 RepID=A0A9P7J7X6_9AGAM|nr:uncharacterized protein BJ212DRAFT_1410023 [Suillus subaureus]XP_041187783.1 uncharacterized protein BJ212DRAFT_1388735 [Suillus subaureus]KAG1795827.1 hypothetical protein BJ212DRAFT_1410023 [Suillus subaureus]KAG1807017.1 hypothetical protein BJ212DRAFT_1388735 [Suillus subaureus]
MLCCCEGEYLVFDGPPSFTKVLFFCSMVYFIIAFSYQVFTPTPTTTLAITGSACGVVALVTLWLVSTARDFHILPWLQARLGAFKDKCRIQNRI